MPQLAFPTAMGAGAYTSGGRGGIVVHVTNLNDSGTGSLRSALVDYAGQDRTIVFDVSGIIELSSDIVISSPSQGGNASGGITIAGQTAPEGGIIITGGKIRTFGVDEIIGRYLKFRSTTNVNGCFSSIDGNNIIFDHFSGSHVESGEVTFSVVSNTEETNGKTIQNTLVANSGLGFIVGDTSPPNDTHNEDISIINNVFVNVGWRAPAKIGGAMRIDIINNTVHNWTSRLIRVDDWSYTMNHQGNYYTIGGRGTVQAHTAYFRNRGTGRIYENDNYLDPDFNTRCCEWTDFDQPRTDPLPAETFVNTPFAYNNPETFSIKQSATLKTDVIPYVGAYKYINDNGDVVVSRDSIDTDAINQAITEDNSQTSAVLTYDITVEEIPSIENIRPGNFYVSNPHIPEVWLESKGITGTPAIHNQVQPSGYTLLEEYINQVDGEISNIPIITLIGNSIINLTVGDTYTEQGATATDIEDGDLTGSIVITGSVDTNTVGTYYINYNVEDSDTNSATQVVRTVNVVAGNTNYNLSNQQRLMGKKELIKLIKNGTL